MIWIFYTFRAFSVAPGVIGCGTPWRGKVRLGSDLGPVCGLLAKTFRTVVNRSVDFPRHLQGVSPKIVSENPRLGEPSPSLVIYRNPSLFEIVAKKTCSSGNEARGGAVQHGSWRRGAKSIIATHVKLTSGVLGERSLTSGPP